MRHFTNWLDAYVNYAGFSEAPPRMHLWTAIGTLAGALRRKVWIDQIYFKWFCNCFIVFVARPGIVSKTTTIGIGMDMLKEVQGINFGPDSVTWQKLAEVLTDVHEQFEYQGEWVDMSAVTFESGEFGTLVKTQDREMIDVLVTLWDGKKFHKATKGSGNDKVQNPWVNILGCTTPAWIADNFPEYMIGGGFTSRCIFVFADEKEKYVAYPRDHIPTSAEGERKKLVADLNHIATKICGEYIISEPAKAWGLQWYEEHYSKIGSLEDARFHGYFARKQTHMHKLAMIFAAAKRDQLVIEKEDLQDALAALNSIEADMPMVFSLIGKSDMSTYADKIAHHVAARGGITHDNLYKFAHGMFPNSQEFDMIVNGLVQAGKIILKMTGFVKHYYPGKVTTERKGLFAE